MKIPAELRLLNHPYYRAWECGHLSKESIAEYAAQYYHHVLAFPRYLSATHSKIEDLQSRQILLENLIEEERGEGNHPELWLRFVEGMGLDRETVRSAKPGPGVRRLIDCFLTLCSSSAAEGLGALFAYESQIPEIAHFKKEALRKFYTDSPRALEFFELHQKADVLHTQALKEVIESLPAEEKAIAQKASETAAKALWSFLDSMSEAHAA